MEYAVLNPSGLKPTMDRVSPSPRLSSLNGKTVYCIAQDRLLFMGEIAKYLQKHAPGVQTVVKRKPGGFAKEDPELREEVIKNADAMIFGTAMGGGSGMAGTDWTVKVEKRGVPAVYLVGEPYVNDIRVSAEMRGMPALRTLAVHLVEEEKVTTDITPEQYSKIALKIIDALTKPLTDQEKKAGKIVPEKQPRIAMTGALDEVQDYFYAQHWTDGLPIIPPTEEKVAKMLQGTSHRPDEVVTTSMFPEELTATVEKIAIVGVMAGCRPEYMPVLLAMVEAWGKGSFNLLVRSASSASFMTIVNGPIRNEIKMNSKINAMGPCNMANASIGRFSRLSVINLGGSYPGTNDMSAQGNPSKYSFCFPENEEDNPWEPFHVSAGFKANESVITTLTGGWNYRNFIGQHPDIFLDSIAKVIVHFQGTGGAFILMTPSAARLFASRGMTKKDVERYISEHAVAPVSELKKNFPLPASLEANKNLAGDTLVQAYAPDSIKVLVVGGESGNPTLQVWTYFSPSTASVDKWR
jgi:hypothetical protein